MPSVFTTAVSGMNAAVTRLMNAATNIANASSTGKLPTTEKGTSTAYQATDVVSVSQSIGDNNFGVDTKVVPRNPSYNVGYDPSSPDADSQGAIAEPNVDIASEIVDTIMAKTAYEANAKMIKVQKETQDALLDTLA